ncbi:MAG: polyphosphate kinase 2 family protein [Acidobacteria bacterium]|nr:polyphosphate kinase 2 family protein [Acidobacteriota bacterium]
MKRFLVRPRTKMDLSRQNPRDTGPFNGGKKEGLAQLARVTEELVELQRLLYAEHGPRLLVVLQAMDTAGKDGTIRHVFGPLNPQGVQVRSFKKPTPRELDHDYLWRVHPFVPGRGEITIFNRSHYEDVLVVRVHGLVPEEVWRRRYRHIVEFERLLTDEGTTILKFFLHISKEEQKERLEARLADPTKSWKFSNADLAERQLWPDYMTAYEEVLNRTSARLAPWYVIPSDRKWFRNLAVATIVRDTLQSMKLHYPEPDEDLDGIVVE